MTDSRRNKVLQIVMYATLLNDSPTSQKITGYKPTVFLDFSGHIAKISVDIHTDGWEADADPDEKYDISLDTSNNDFSEKRILSKTAQRVDRKSVV